MTNSNHECVNMPLTNKIFEFQSNSPGSFPSLCCYLLYFRFSVKFIHFESKHSLTSRCVRVKNGFCCVFLLQIIFYFCFWNNRWAAVSCSADGAWVGGVGLVFWLMGKLGMGGAWHLVHGVWCMVTLLYYFFNVVKV